MPWGVVVDQNVITCKHCGAELLRFSNLYYAFIPQMFYTCSACGAADAYINNEIEVVKNVLTEIK